MNVGCVSYINTLPLRLPFQLGHIHTSATFTYAIPSKLNALLREGTLDVALSSSVEYLDGNYHLLPQFGIVSQNRVMSVNLYTRVPVEQLHGVPIRVTSHSATSVSLLKVLCHHVWKVTPVFTTEQGHSDQAFLLIGDEALQERDIAGFHTIDLATAWYEMTGLPFVFAVFSARKDVAIQTLSQLQHEISDALTWSEHHLKEIEEAAVKQCLLPLERIRAYYATLSYHLGVQEIKSLELFRNLRHDV